MKVLFSLFLVLAFNLIIFGQTFSIPEKDTITKNNSTADIKTDGPDICFFPETRGALKARVDALYSILAISPNAKGLVINYGTNKEIAKRIATIKSAIKFRKYDKRLVIYAKAIEKDSFSGTQIFILDPKLPVKLPAFEL